MKKIKKIIKNNIVGFIIGVIIAITISAYAATMLQSNAVYYDNSKSGGTSNTVSGAIDELYEKTKTTDFKVGDYVSMTPSSTSFTIPAILTGYSSDQTINPSELNLWRVIRINDDETVEMISEYVSSTNVYFQGRTGYQNLAGSLNYIAKQYENRKYTVGSRHMGYSFESEYTEKEYYTLASTDYIAEKVGVVKSAFLRDIDLLKAAIGSEVANKYGTSTPSGYYSACRHSSGSGSSAGVRGAAGGRLVRDREGNNYGFSLYGFSCDTDCKNCSYTEEEANYAIRPIVILKSKIKASSGNGTSASPYVLS